MKMRYVFVVAAFLLTSTGRSPAAEIRLRIDHILPSLLPDYRVFDILVSFDHIIRGQQMIVELSRGSIYQHELGSELPVPPRAPSQFLINAFPEIAYDTFVTMGGPTAQTSHGAFFVGGAVNLQPGAQAEFDSDGINAAWAPGTGVDIRNETDFLTARLTLSKYAAGTLYYFASTADGTEARWDFEFDFIPEPGSVALAALALCGFGAISWRRTLNVT